MFDNKRKIMFTGNYLDLLTFLKKKGFWEDKLGFESSLKLHQEIGDLNSFANFTIDIQNGRVGQEGVAYPADKAPSYPKVTIFKLRTEGFSDKEINLAFGKTVEELNLNRRQSSGKGFKDFLLEKFTE